MGGAPGTPHVTQLGLEYTSTQSVFTFDVAGKVHLTVTFLSPVYPDDLARQSQQFSYISVKARASDLGEHKVQVYMDVSGGEALPSLSAPGLCSSRVCQNGPVAMFPRLSSGMPGRREMFLTCSSPAITRGNSPSLERLPAGAHGIWLQARSLE